MGKKKSRTIVYLNQKYLKKNIYNIPSVMGEIYELHCYNYILDNYRNINIIKSKCVKEEKFGNLEYSQNGKIIFTSNNIVLAEYDALGVSQNKIIWWEITRHKKLENDFLEKLNVKKYLLSKIFTDYEIVLKIIATKQYSKLKEYEITIVNEPYYDFYYSEYRISKNIQYTMPLKTLAQKSTNYDYIDEVINVSKVYYSDMNYDIANNHCIIGRVYNLDTINNQFVEYFDVRRNIKGRFEMTDTVKNSQREVFYNRLIQEIIEIRKKMNDNKQGMKNR